MAPMTIYGTGTMFKVSLLAPIILIFCIFIVLLRYSTQKPPQAYKTIVPTRPHIVFILADDLGYNDIGYHAIHGMSAVKTPQLDALANEGVKLENYYVQPICSPSRSVLMTGRYQIRYGLQHRLLKAPQPTCLPLSERTLPQTLNELGYATHAVGKWHLGFCRSECLPTRRGFDSFFGYAVGGMDHFLHTRVYLFPQAEPFKTDSINTMNASYSTYNGDNLHNVIDDLEDVGATNDESIPKQYWKGKDLWENETVVWEHEGEYSTTLFSERAQNIIEKHNPKQPLFLYLAYKNVHRPLQAPKSYVDKFEHIANSNRRLMAAMTYIMDEGVKNITETLKKMGMWEHTVLIFSTDNGGMVKTDSAGNNWPLKGGKWSLWEGGIRAIGFVNSPLLSDKVKGTVNRGLMHISDWFSTLVDGVAGGSTTNLTKPLDGVNQWEMISKNQSSARNEILHNIDNLEDFPDISAEEEDYWRQNLDKSQAINPLIQASIRIGDWKLMTGANIGRSIWLPPPESGLTKQRLSNTSQECTQRGSVVRLYNIKTDPQETCNLARNPKYLAKVKEAMRRLRGYADEAVPEYYPEEDAMANPALSDGAWYSWLNNDLETYAKIYPFKVRPFM